MSIRKSSSSIFTIRSAQYVPPSGGLPPVEAQILVVGGGGAGSLGTQSGYRGGGGGAGAFVEVSAINLPRGISHAVTVGAGGTGTTNAGTVTSGSDSVFGFTTATTNIEYGIRAHGGGAGAGSGYSGGVNGGSGGGGGGGSGGAAILDNRGFAGGTGNGSHCGGGGGAGAVGYNWSANPYGQGGIGKQSSITGTATYYAGGGGGANGNATRPAGGNGGGGYACNSDGSVAATSGTTNLGAGGGGTLYGNLSGNGGSGVVIVKFLTSAGTPVVTGSPTVTTSGSYSVYKFTQSGTITF